MGSAGSPRPSAARLQRASVIAAVAAGVLLSGCNSSSGSADTGAPADSTGTTSSQHTTASSAASPETARPAPARPAGKRTRAGSLSCADVKQAFIVADVAFSGIEDDTAATQKAAKAGTLPYAITMHCVVRLPGVRHPQHVQLDRTPGNSTKLVTALGSVGSGKRLPAAQGYGDVGYVIPQGDGTYALLAGKGNWVLDIGDLRHTDDVESIAHYLLGRL